jgi:acyl-CoA dehydrogenase
LSYQIPERLRPLRDRVLHFIETNIYPHEPLLFSGTAAARAKQAELIALAKAQGLFALGHPTHMGGGGLSWLDYAYINEVIGRSDAALDIFGSYTVQTCLMLDAAGTQKQKDALVYPQVRGETYVAFSVTEPDSASSDPTNIQTTAVLDGDEWILNGRKWFISGLDHADWVCFMCRTEGEEAPLHERFSMLVVPIDAKGLTVVRDLHTMGLRHLNHPEVALENVRVPADNLLGGRGQGFQLFQVRLGPARITNCMRWLGQAQRAFDIMCDRVNARKLADGKPLADKQLIQQYVYDSYVELQSARLLVLDAAERLDGGDQARIEVSAIKCYCARILHNVIDRALQVHGALGVSGGTPLEHMYRMARIYRIVDGPDEVHIERVGKLILRGYREDHKFDFGLH